MSSKPEAQNEPTMEEILASIRRIISEDEPQGGKPVDSIPPATPLAAAKAPVQPAPPPRGAENILELTKMVAEDGSIVDLAAAAPDEEAAGEMVPDEMAAEEAAPEPVAEEPVAVEPVGERAGELAEEPAEEDDAEPEAAEALAAYEEASAGELLSPAQDATADDEWAEDLPAAAQVPAPAAGDSDFVSAATAAAATASLAAVTKAAMANRQGGAVAIGGGRTLEELVRESLAPELKGWLDDNLPDLVERIVREEIRKMVRRAEEQ